MIRIIISANRSNCDAPTNQSATNALEKYLDSMRRNAVKVEGAYDGMTEESFMFFMPNTEDYAVCAAIATATNLAVMMKQECSYIAVDGMAFLVYQDGRLQYIGHEVTDYVLPENVAGFTILPDAQYLYTELN